MKRWIKYSYFDFSEPSNNRKCRHELEIFFHISLFIRYPGSELDTKRNFSTEAIICSVTYGNICNCTRNQVYLHNVMESSSGSGSGAEPHQARSRQLQDHLRLDLGVML